MDFAAWVVKGVAADQFYCAGGAAAGCPTINIIGPAGPVPVDRSTFLISTLLHFSHGQMYLGVIWAGVNVLGFALAFALIVRFVSHQKR